MEKAALLDASHHHCYSNNAMATPHESNDVV
jgi:hypothetical protein